MKTVTVGLPGSRYDILIGEGLLGSLGGLAKQYTGAPVAVVTDVTVWNLYRKPFENSLRGAGIDILPVILSPGERNKSMEGLERLYNAFVDGKLRRDSLVIAFGGGVVGDLCGFAAATYMRGIRYIQVPTTLLAQVDSSVGGKTAINLPQGKNLAGAFYQPQLAVIDTAALGTLSVRDFRCGMAEVIKYGAIRSKGLFQRLTRQIAQNDMIEIISECVSIKSKIVERDERDTGERMLLNFGHTFGHAVENLGSYETYNHGEAVAIGMVIAAAVGEETGVTAAGCTQRLKTVLELHGLDTVCPFSALQLFPLMTLDKKSGADGVQLVLIKDIGDAFVWRTGFDGLRTILEKAEHRWTVN